MIFKNNKKCCLSDKQIVKKEKANLCLNVYCFFCKPNKTEKTPRSIAVVLLLILWRITARELKMMEIFMVFDNTNVVFVSVR
jgi:hypothetical protein